MDYGKVVSFAFTGWIRDRTALKNALWVLVISLVFAGIVLSLGAALFSSLEDYGLYQLSGSSLAGNAASADSPFLFEVIIFVLGVVLFFILTYFSGCIIRQALLRNNGQAVPFNFSKGLRLAVLGIVSALVALFTWYDKKWLALLLVVLVGGVLFYVGFTSDSLVLLLVGILGALLAFLAGLAYAIIVIYSSIRLSLSEIFFVEKEQSIVDSLSESWNLTNKRVFTLLGAGIVVGILLLVVIFIISLPSIALYIATIFSQEFLVSALVVGVILDSIIRAVSVLITSFALVEIYRQIKVEPVSN